MLQVGDTPEETEGLQVLNSQSTGTEEWIPVHVVPNSFVVNFGNAFEAATSGGVRATVHRVLVRIYKILAIYCSFGYYYFLLNR